MARIFRTVNLDLSVRLDLNTASGLQLVSLDLGRVPAEVNRLSAPGSSGVIDTGVTRREVPMGITLKLNQQVSTDAELALMDSLATEMSRVNVIEFRPVGASASTYIDTLISDVETLFNGQVGDGPDDLKRSTEAIAFTWLRQPDFRGPYTHF